MKSLWGMFVLGSLTCAPAFASIVYVTSPAALAEDDTASWSQLGATQTSIPSSFSATSVGGLAITGTIASGTGTVLAIPTDWPAGPNFSSGDSVIWTSNGSTDNGPLTLAFSALFGAGAYVQADGTGAFTGSIQAFGSGGSLGTFTASSSNGDPIFLGVLDTLQEVTSIKLSLTVAPANFTVFDFAVDTLYLNAPVSATPEPGSLVLVGGALAGLGWKLRRRTRTTGRL